MPGCWWSISDAVDRINRVDEAITLATLPAFKAVVAGEMIATVKIIPFGVPAALRDAAVAAVARRAAVRVVPYRVRKVGVVSTLLPGLAPKVIDKTLRITAERLAPAGAQIVAERRVPTTKRKLGARDRGAARSRRRTRDRVRRLGDRRSPRRDSGGDRADRRRDQAVRHAGRSRQPAADRSRRRPCRCSARRAARARRRKTASTGC